MTLLRQKDDERSISRAHLRSLIEHPALPESAGKPRLFRLRAAAGIVGRGGNEGSDMAQTAEAGGNGRGRPGRLR